MVAAGQLAVELQFWDRATRASNSSDSKKSWTTQLPAGVDIEAILDALQTDKKVKAGRVRFVPTQIGAATLTDQVPPDTIRRFCGKNPRPGCARM